MLGGVSDEVAVGIDGGGGRGVSARGKRPGKIGSPVLPWLESEPCVDYE